MRKLTVLAIVTVFISNAVYAQSGWDEGLFWAEAGVGALAGMGFGLITYKIANNRSNVSNHTDWNSIGYMAFSYPAGTSLGVILYGNLKGAPPQNPVWTYLASIGTSYGIAIPSMSFSWMISSEALAYGSMILTSLATAAIYNTVKRPRAEETVIDTRITISPYTELLSERDGGFVPTYGIIIGM